MTDNTNPSSAAARYRNDNGQSFLPTLGGYGDVAAFAINALPTVNSVPLIGINNIANPCPNFTNPVQVGAFPNATGFQCNVAGTYQITWQVDLNNQGVGTTPAWIALLGVLNNGATILQGNFANHAFGPSGSTSSAQTFFVSKVCNLQIGDVVDFRVTTTAGLFSAVETTFASFVRVQ